MEARSSSSGGCGSIGGGMHEHGEWEMTGGSQAKVFRIIAVRGLRIKKGGNWSLWGGGGPRSKQVMVCPLTKAREQDTNMKQGYPKSEKSRGFVFLVVSTKGSKVVDRRR